MTESAPMTPSVVAGVLSHARASVVTDPRRSDTTASAQAREHERDARGVREEAGDVSPAEEGEAKIDADAPDDERDLGG